MSETLAFLGKKEGDKTPPGANVCLGREFCSAGPAVARGPAATCGAGGSSTPPHPPAISALKSGAGNEEPPSNDRLSPPGLGKRESRQFPHLPSQPAGDKAAFWKGMPVSIARERHPPEGISHPGPTSVLETNAVRAGLAAQRAAPVPPTLLMGLLRAPILPPTASPCR